MADMPMFTKYAVAGIPFYTTTAYLFLFFVNKPPHYHSDFWNQLFYGADFNYSNRLGKKRIHPAEKIERKRADNTELK